MSAPANASRPRRGLLLALGLAAAACSAAPPAPPARQEAPPAPAAIESPAAPSSSGPAVELVESAPVETSLDHADVPNADAVWVEMIEGAKRSIDVAQFYISNTQGGRLEPVLRAIEAAADRGVRVRVLVDQSFYGKYPDSVDRLASREGIEARRLDMSARTKGVLHAKYFVVDGREAYLGSQNFDWRALAHIQEIGVRVRSAEIARALGDVFDVDWGVAGGADPAARARARPAGAAAQVVPLRAVQGGAPIAMTPVASPPGWLPDEALWDLPRLRAMIDGARQSVHVQLLSYRTRARDGSPFTELDEAMRRAGARGVDVRLLVSHWSTKAGTIEALQSLATAPGVAVRLITIPRWSGGFIPFARVSHAKYMVVDGASAWVGTSNWEGDYFTRSRNVGLVLEGAPVAARLDRIFEDGWSGPYAAAVDPAGHYAPPSVDREAPPGDR
ncbi:MAG: phospholipase [Polyangiaceae bacterium]|nr:phospholipase [Polyangiaceae bacterium]